MNLEELSLKEIIDEIAKQIEENPSHKESLRHIYNLDVNDQAEGKYGIDFSGDKLLIQNKHFDTADCELSMKMKELKKLLQGDLNTTVAFMTGKLKVNGNIGLALKLESVLKQLTFK